MMVYSAWESCKVQSHMLQVISYQSEGSSWLKILLLARYDQYKDAWDTGVAITIDGEPVRFFHTKKKGVDRIWVDHPAFLAKVTPLVDAAFRLYLLCKLRFSCGTLHWQTSASSDQTCNESALMFWRGPSQVLHSIAWMPSKAYKTLPHVTAEQSLFT